MHLRRMQLLLTILTEIKERKWRPTAGEQCCFPQVLHLDSWSNFQAMWIMKPYDNPKPSWIVIEGCTLTFAAHDSRIAAEGFKFHPIHVLPVYKLYKGFEAAAKFFNLGWADTKILFGPVNNIEVGHHIDIAITRVSSAIAAEQKKWQRRMWLTKWFLSRSERRR